MIPIIIFRKNVFNFIVLIVIILLSTKDTLQQDPFQCGIPQISRSELIVQGHDTIAGAWPWHAAIYHRNRRSDSYACGGTLISEQFVLTAAHCVFDPDNRQQLVNHRIFVRLGVHNLDLLNRKSFQQHEIHKIYKPINSTGDDFRNDIAILELSTLVVLDDFVQPACLSLSKDLTNQYGTVIGWGVAENDDISRILKSTQIPVVDAVTCLKSNRKVFGNTLDEGIFCAGYTNGTSVCNGDSGGGLFFNVDNAWYLGGIVSYSKPRDGSNLCDPKSYGAFTKVYTYLPWISSVTKLKFLKDEEALTADDLRPELDSCEPSDVDPSKTYTNTLLPRNCGVYLTNRIIKGNRTDVFEFPWMALILYRTPHRVCAGTLISKRYVLTSTRCTWAYIEPIKVRLGEHTIGQDRDCNGLDDNSDCAPPVRDYRIECIIRHQSYTPGTISHTIALIRLDRNVQFEDHIQPICLPVTDFLKKLNPQKYIITGWGDTELERKSMQLLKTFVTSAKPYFCRSWIHPVFRKRDQRQLCVKQTDGPDACLGDSGGPLGYSAPYNGMRFIQFGIVSFGSGCGAVPSIYTKVAYYMDWISANMKS
ncbi:transmembrane protease serine 9-like [Ochlerotatus camptorhynchus]|uniref:transmembrane protease serine 9-like n=1 Tax=Ochlerotatus camptorhynchus TaxID=644619 RepID=UPI0031CE0012